MLSQQLPGGGNYLFHADFKQAIVRPRYMAVAGVAGGTAEHDTFCTKRTVARRISRPEDSDHRDSKGRRQMHGPVSPPINKRARRVRAISCVSDPVKSQPCRRWRIPRLPEFFFSGTEVDQRFHAVFRQPPGHFSITFGRPLLCSPASARIQQRELCVPCAFSRRSHSCSAGDVTWKVDRRDFQRLAGQQPRRETNSVPQRVRHER